MQCYYHPDVEAVGTCKSCGKAICQTCAVDVSGKIHCQQCLSSGAVSKRSIGTSEPTNTLAIVSLVLSILGLVGCCCSPIVGMVFGIPAAFVGYTARKQIRETEQQGLQLATIGMALGLGEAAVGLLLLIFIGSTLGLSFFTETLQNLSN